MLKILGAENSIDFDGNPATDDLNDFNKAYQTPKNYGDEIKRKNKN